MRTSEDEDVVPYVQEVDIQKVYVELPDIFKDIKNYFDKFIKSKTRELQNLGFVTGTVKYTKKNLLGLQAAIHAKIAQGERDFETLRSMSLLAEIMKIQHAIELA